MPNQNIDLGNTADVQFNSQQVDKLYLNSDLIWERVLHAPLGSFAISNTDTNINLFNCFTTNCVSPSDTPFILQQTWFIDGNTQYSPSHTGTAIGSHGNFVSGNGKVFVTATNVYDFGGSSSWNLRGAAPMTYTQAPDGSYTIANGGQRPTNISLSHDGNTLVYSYENHPNSPHNDNSIHAFDWNGSAWVERLAVHNTATTATHLGGFGMNPVISGDGNTIIFEGRGFVPRPLYTYVRSGFGSSFQLESKIGVANQSSGSNNGGIWNGTCSLNYDGTVLAHSIYGRYSPHPRPTTIHQRYKSSPGASGGWANRPGVSNPIVTTYENQPKGRVTDVKISYDGNSMLVGFGNSYDKRGYALVYKYSNGTLGSPTQITGQVNDALGYGHNAISNDGNTVYLIAPRFYTNTTHYAGESSVQQWDYTSSWSKTHEVWFTNNSPTLNQSSATRNFYHPKVVNLVKETP